MAYVCGILGVLNHTLDEVGIMCGVPDKISLVKEFPLYP